MAKIWEVDFTSFSGSSMVAYDKIGTQHLTTYSGVTLAPLMGGFTTRSGAQFSLNGSQAHKYGLLSAGVTNAIWRKGFYQKRSFSCWVFLRAPGNTSYWPSGGGPGGPIWGSYNSSANNPMDCFFIENTGYLIVEVNSTDWYDTSLTTKFFKMTEGWHHFLMIIDGVADIGTLYIDGIYAGAYPYLPNTSTTSDDRIGDGENLGFWDGTFQLGNLATYDHLLTPAEVSGIYNKFLNDSPTGDQPAQTLSGTVYGSNNIPVSSGTVYAQYDGSYTLQSTATISSSGTYSIALPYYGKYVLTFNTGNTTKACIVYATQKGASFL